MHASQRRQSTHAAVLSGIGAAALGLLGCAHSDDAIGFQEQDPAARLRAVRRAAETRDQSSIPQLIDELESDDPAQRMLAIQALQEITGQTLGYDHAAGPEQRAAAVRRWAEWYSQRSETTK